MTNHTPHRISPEPVQEQDRSLGIALGHRLAPGAIVVLGNDGGAEAIARSGPLIEGLIDAGLRIVDLRTVPSAIVHHAKHRIGAQACLFVQGHDGLDGLLGDEPLCAEALAESVKTTADTALPKREGGRCVTHDMSGPYIEWLHATWSGAPQRNVRIVLDACHGPWARLARMALQAVFPQALITAIRDEPISSANSTSGADALCEAVDCERADVGVSLNGDRLLLADGEGVLLSPEEAACCLLQSFGESLVEETCVCDPRFSPCVGRLAEKLGAKVVASSAGHANMRRTMAEHGAALAAETDGRFYFRALCDGDDPLFAACWLIDFLLREGTTLAALRKRCPRVCVSHEMRLPADPAMIATVMASADHAWTTAPRETHDGLRLIFHDGWAHIRPLHAESTLTFRFEAGDADALDDRVLTFCEQLPTIGDELWRCYRGG